MSKIKVRLCVFFVMGFMTFVLNAQAASSSYSDNFENDNYSGWTESITNGTGSFSVSDKNASKMAHVYHSGSGMHSLSKDFIYNTDDTLSFDMLAIAVYGGNNADSGCGVKISFLTPFNTILGYATFTNRTDDLSTNQNGVDQNQHNYNGLMSTYATFAGIEGTDPDISKINLSFFSWGETTMKSTFAGPHYYSGSANVWFDNVSIVSSTVPVPGTLGLFISGLLGLIVWIRPEIKPDF